ncbi:MAG: excinuclease ABC subunit UvrC [Candidatus Gracilibacteria bacterium]|jgi:excinuclease ABC subunit C|nr:excinuclease ABC subunit UvrC [Candidatus Gracilibacteria bacterium]
MSEKFAKIIASMPKTTGVYKLKDKNGEIIYIGKAKNIKDRIKSHLQGTSVSYRAKKMRDATESVDYTEVSNETESLILENNLIKELKPKYNILLRDDKSFFFIKVTLNEDFPRILLSRQVTKDGSRYFGPKTSSTSARKTIDLLNSIFKFRTCKLDIKSNGEIKIPNKGAMKIPCLEHHIKRCDAPCIGKISKQKYNERIENALKFLNGDIKPILKQIEQEMQQSAQEGNFEKAALKRDLMFAIQNFSEKQIITDVSDFTGDVLGLHTQFEKMFFHLFEIRQGRIINSEDFFVDLGDDPAESLFAFLRNYKKIKDKKNHIILSADIFPENEKESWESYLNAEIILPKIGKKKDLIELAQKNAENYSKRNAPQFLKAKDREKEALEELKEKLDLGKTPERIEAYDISHLHGQNKVASMVVAENGEMKNTHYRHFKIKSLKEGDIDDFKSMAEVISRRFKYLEDLSDEFTFKKATKKDLEKIKSNLINEEKNYLILRKGDDIAGFIREYVYEKENLHLLTDIFIDKNYRGQNLAYYLVKKAISRSKAKKIYIRAFNKEMLLDIGFIEIKKTPEILEKSPILNLKTSCKSKDEYLIITKKKQDESFTKKPDLILIDGGKGQLKAALDSIQDKKGVVFCALAKREEEVFIKGSKKPIDITKDSKAGLLLQKIRDESHRFAVEFNRKLRDNNLFKQ